MESITLNDLRLGTMGLLNRSSPQSNSQSADDYKCSTYHDGWRWQNAEKNKVSDLENYEQRRYVHTSDDRELDGGQVEGSTVKRKQRVAEQEEADPG